MLRKFFGNGSTTMIHKSVFKKIGLFKEMAHSEDYEMWLRALSKGIRFELVPAITLVASEIVSGAGYGDRTRDPLLGKLRFAKTALPRYGNRDFGPS